MPVSLSATVVLYDIPLSRRLLRPSGERHGISLVKVPKKYINIFTPLREVMNFQIPVMNIKAVYLLLHPGILYCKTLKVSTIF